MTPLLLLGALGLLGCNPDPGEPAEIVDFRDVTTGPTSGERGTIKITEVFWSGSVEGEGDERRWRPEDVFLELRNEGNRPVNLSRWFLEVEGAIYKTFRIPETDFVLEVGEQVAIARTRSGCFPNAELVIPDLEFPRDDAFRVTLMDADERLMESGGAKDMPPFAGGYDLVTSRSMERIQLMFGGQGNMPAAWHHYNRKPCPEGTEDPEGVTTGLSCFESIPNNDLVKPECRRHTLASPGRPNSPDYSGAFANGGFE